jgi:hypothetical protein
VADRCGLGLGLRSGLEPQAVHGLARARHCRHHRPISEPMPFQRNPLGRYHWRDVAWTGDRSADVANPDWPPLR